MNRREFVKASGAVLAAGAFAPSAAASGAPRQLLRLHQDWRFSAVRRDGDTAPKFDDRVLERVTLPHTNKLLPWHSFDEKSYQFSSLYRRRFTLPGSARGQRVFVDFEGAMAAATVWLNGHQLGTYKGGYTPFSFELTEHLNGSGENLLAVELDSTELSDTPPFGGSIDY